MTIESNDTSRYQDVSNMFALCILSNSGFEEYAQFSQLYGHPKNRSYEENIDFARQLSKLKEEDLETYTKMYENFFSILLEDNLKGISSPYNIFSRAREFADNILQILNNKADKEEIIKGYLTLKH